MAARRRIWTTDVAFADVAMAVLGPVMLLLVLFVLLAAQGERPPDCRTLTPAETDATAADLTAWLATSDTWIGATSADLRRRCGDTAETAVAEADVVLPGRLVGLCEADIQAVATAAQTDLERVRAVAAARTALERGLAMCLRSIRDTGCRRLSPSQLRQSAGALEGWRSATLALIDADAARIRRDCPHLLDTPTTDVTAVAPPPELAGLCAADRDALVAAAGVSLTEIDRLLGQMQANLSRLRRCEPEQQEIVEVTDSQLQFRNCSTEFITLATRQTMTAEEINEFFVARAREVQSKLEQSRYNRIDILGHSDARPVPQGGCGRARDNHDLSSLRAQAFRRALEQAILTNPEFAPLQDRLRRGRLRFYAIGVGDAEPKRPDAQTDTEHAVNRRIEMRFVVDRLEGRPL